MASLKLLSIAGEFMLHVDDTTCGDGRENYFEIVLRIYYHYMSIPKAASVRIGQKLIIKITKFI